MGLAGYKIKEQITTQHLRVGPRLLEPLVQRGKANDESCSVCHDAPLRLQLLRTGGYRFERTHARVRKITGRFASWAFAVWLPEHDTHICMDVAGVAAAFVWQLARLEKIYHRNKISINQ